MSDNRKTISHMIKSLPVVRYSAAGRNHVFPIHCTVVNMHVGDTVLPMNFCSIGEFLKIPIFKVVNVNKVLITSTELQLHSTFTLVLNENSHIFP